VNPPIADSAPDVEVTPAGCYIKQIGSIKLPVALSACEEGYIMQIGLMKLPVALSTREKGYSNFGGAFSEVCSAKLSA
jgi:hypothetical protein